MNGHKWFAAIYDRMNRLDGTEKFLAKHRPYVAGEAEGTVLEVGAGTGANFPYFKKDAKVTAIEPDPYMFERAKKRLAELGLEHIKLVQHPAEQLPFDDSSFDHVVSSMVFCSVRDPQRALAEVKRVLKSGGSFRFIEHVRSQNAFGSRLQDFVQPVWTWFGAGCHPNRRTLQSIEQAGLQVEEVQRLRHSMVPVVVGVARPK